MCHFLVSIVFSHFSHMCPGLLSYWDLSSSPLCGHLQTLCMCAQVVSFIYDGSTYSPFTVLFKCCLHQEGCPGIFCSTTPTSLPGLGTSGILCPALSRTYYVKLSKYSFKTENYWVLDLNPLYNILFAIWQTLYQCLLIWRFILVPTA